MHPRTASLLLFAFSGLLQAQSASVKPLGFAGHNIGESVKIFLRLEPGARDELEVCEQHPDQTMCIHLFAAVEKGQRAELSTAVPADLDHPEVSNDTRNFVLDGGQLVKITLSVNDVAEVMNTFGKPSSDTVTQHHNDSGAQWENRLCVWEMPSGYVTLDADNNPRLQDHRPLLVLESRAEHARSTAPAPKTSTAPPPPTNTPLPATGKPVSYAFTAPR
jgi:hypothetical protein